MHSRTARILFCIAIFIIAFGLRLAGIGWGLKNDLHNQSYHPDEPLIFDFVHHTNLYGAPDEHEYYNYGTLAAQVFFGLWLVPLGYLAYKSSGWFPKWLGALLVVGGVCYIVDLLAAFLVPDFGKTIHTSIVIPCAVAEISMVLYLLVVGVRTPKTKIQSTTSAVAA